METQLIYAIDNIVSSGENIIMHTETDGFKASMYMKIDGYAEYDGVIELYSGNNVYYISTDGEISDCYDLMMSGFEIKNGNTTITIQMPMAFDDDND